MANGRDLPKNVAHLSGPLSEDLYTLGGTHEVDIIELRQTLLALSRLIDVQAAMEECEVTVSGSTGQVRVNPLIARENRLRREVFRGFDRLGLSLGTRSHGVRVAENGRLEVRSSRPAELEELMEMVTPRVYE